MDIILDSNAVGLDFNFRANRFRNLFDYIRRTGSPLVIPRAVQTEIIATFKRTLEERVAGAQGAWRELHRMLVNYRDFDGPDSNYEIQQLEGRLLHPSPGIAVISFEPSIDAMEVVRRGASRIRPANDKGEELRDVIIWLTALEYAKSVSREVVFVSDDRGFWKDAKHETLHPDIERDIAAASVNLKVYSTLDRYMQNNSLAKAELTAEAASQYFDRELAAGQVCNQVRNLTIYWNGHIASSVSLDSVEFQEGTLFEISSDVKFAEMVYLCSFSIEVQQVVYALSRGRAPVYNSLWEEKADVAIPLYDPWSVVTSYGAVQTTPIVTSNVFVGSAYDSTQTYAYQPLNVYQPIAEPPANASTIEVKALASFSSRWVSGTVEKLELDKFFIAK